MKNKCFCCNHEINDEFIVCPYCGKKVKMNYDSVLEDGVKKAYFIIGIITIVLMIIFCIMIYRKNMMENIDEVNDDVKIKDVYDIIEDSIDSEFNNIYDGELRYYSHSIISYGKKNEKIYEPSGDIYYSKLYSDKKWKGTFSCGCSVDVERQTGGCSCSRSGTATIVW